MSCLIFLLVVYLQSFQWLIVLSTPNRITIAGCEDHCGDVQIPYPFGIGANCFHEESYEIICNSSFSPSKPFLRHVNNLEVLEIAMKSQTITVSMPPLNICSNVGGNVPVDSIDLKGSPYWFLDRNVLMVEGCSGRVVLMNSSRDVLGRCITTCPDNGKDVSQTGCLNSIGVGCCRGDLLSGFLDFYRLGVAHIGNSTACKMVAALVDGSFVRGVSSNISGLVSLPTVLGWKATYQHQAFYDNVTCLGSGFSSWYHNCSCNFPYEGNPYLPHGCQVVRLCQECINECARATDGTPFCSVKSQYLSGSILWFSLSVGILLAVLLVGGCCLYHRLNRRKEYKKKENYMKNGGVLLLNLLGSWSQPLGRSVSIFTIDELRKATDNFNNNRILGQGGQGTVYKGTIHGIPVAIKKALEFDDVGLMPQFINEVVVLSQIVHPNVVKIVGYCLETDVPMLVYEFISNGTLYQHLHSDADLSWERRLQIAVDSAAALAYIHSVSTHLICHRDFKSTNILLDDAYRAKVSDFGMSKAITSNQTHVTTCVRGTFGYLDPEYFLSRIFTQKSDVYSFGVVLVELLTGQYPFLDSPSRQGFVNLACEFLSHMERSSLHDILDKQIYKEELRDVFLAVANLARQCLRRNSKKRPSMEDVARGLLEIQESCSRSCSEAVRSSAEHDYEESFSEPDDSIESAYMSVEGSPLMAKTF